MVKEEVDEVRKEITEIKAKQVETGGKVKEEIIECMNMLYLQRDKVLEDQAKREEVSTVKVSHGETGHVHYAIECVSSLGGIKDPGFLGVPNVPSVQRASMMECVPGKSGVACMSECKSAGHALTHTVVAV